MKEEKEKGNMEVALKTPEMGNPFQMMRRFTRDMERMFEDFQGFTFPNFFRTDFPRFRMEFDKVKWVPQIEVLHNNEQFMVRADLPGLTKDDVKVEVTNDVLTLSGERKEEKEEKRKVSLREFLAWSIPFTLICSLVCYALGMLFWVLPYAK